MANKITVLLADDHTLGTAWVPTAAGRRPRRHRRRGSQRRRRGRETRGVAQTPRRRDGLRDARHVRSDRDEADSSTGPETAVLMFSMHSEATLVRQALDSGARGYMLKDALDLDLAAAVKKVAAGETVLDPKLSKPATLKGERDHGLSPRELEVLG